MTLQTFVHRSRMPGSSDEVLDWHLRTGAFYRRRLRADFQDCGGGVFCARRAGVALFELEGA